MPEPSTIPEPSAKDPSVDEMWRAYLTTGDVPGAREMGLTAKDFKRLMRAIPSDPRCTLCYVPFGGVGAPVARLLFGRKRSRMNPKWCNVCEQFAEHNHGGAEIELSMLFADIRGSTSLAQEMSPSEFRRQIERFYNVTVHLMIQSNAMIQDLIGDEVAGLYVPGLAGPDHARVALETAHAILHATGHADATGPWIPVGIGVHTGIAFVGAVGSTQGLTTITALGDAVNTTARLASAAGPGEILVSEATCRAAGLDVTGLEARRLSLKGRDEPVDVRVVQAATTLSPAHRTKSQEVTHD